MAPSACTATTSREKRTKSGRTWKVDLQQDRRERGARPHLARASGRTFVSRSYAATRKTKTAAVSRSGPRARTRRPPLPTKPGANRWSRSKPTEPSEERGEEDDQRAGHEQRREELAAQERTGSAPVDDVERRLEHAEERERRPEQERRRRSRRAWSRSLVIASTTRTMSLIDCDGKELLELPDEVARLLGPPGEAEQREREEDQRDGGEQAEVGDHRGEVGAPVGEELRHGLRRAGARTPAVSSRRWMPRPHSPT